MVHRTERAGEVTSQETLKWKIEHANAVDRVNDLHFKRMQEAFTQYLLEESTHREAARLIQDLLTTILTNANSAVFSLEEISDHESCREPATAIELHRARVRSILIKLSKGLHKMTVEDFY